MPKLAGKVKTLDTIDHGKGKGAEAAEARVAELEHALSAAEKIDAGRMRAAEERAARLQAELDEANRNWWKVRDFRQRIAPEVCGGTDFWDAHTPEEIAAEARRIRDECIDAIVSIVKQRAATAEAQRDDALSGLRYIASRWGRLDGVGWDRLGIAATDGGAAGGPKK
jgi:hypothetical protein